MGLRGLRAGCAACCVARGAASCGAGMRLILLAAAASAVGPVQKVIQLLDELSQKVTTNGDAELAEFNEYRQWCDSERRTKERSISTAKRSVNDLTATFESSKAAIDQLNTRSASSLSPSPRMRTRS